eukprot:Seg265.1 transcript_id=Seg265.1/GoldUCD/mRNA.D3Y31 product="hypothetical protein" protein_id=Seg265.1/GoldUCD/D3Y31
MTLLAYPSSMMEVGLISNGSEQINAESSGYLSSSDEEEADMSPYGKSKTADPPSKILADAQRILYAKESRTEELRDKNSSCIMRTTIEMNGILVRKINDDNFEKTKKSVRFNMDKIQLHEYTLDASDALSSVSIDDGAFIATVLDASDLLASDSELSEDDTNDNTASKEHVRFAFSDDQIKRNDRRLSDDRTSITSSIDSFTSADLNLPPLPVDTNSGQDVKDLSEEKVKLQRDIVELKAEYESELKKLREEYETRRESYITELEDMRQTMDESIHSKDHEEKLQSYAKEKKSIDELEEELGKRKKQCLEREEEITEYEQYLDKRHLQINEKEQDLNTLQSELDEFSKLLRKRERDLKAKSERIENEYNKEFLIKACTHDENEIQALRDKVRELQNRVLKTKIDVEKKEENCREFEDKLQNVETDNKKLHAKVKNLETQLALDRKISEARMDCDHARRTSVMAVGSLSSQRFSTNDLRSPPLTPRSLSGRRSLRPPMNGSLISNNNTFLNNATKRKISEATEISSVTDQTMNTTQRTDSKSVKSRTCVVM